MTKREEPEAQGDGSNDWPAGEDQCVHCGHPRSWHSGGGCVGTSHYECTCPGFSSRDEADSRNPYAP